MMLVCVLNAQNQKNGSKPDAVKPKLTTSQIFNKFHSSVVKVVTDKGVGTGFFIQNSATIITANHVLKDASEITIKSESNEIWNVSTLQIDLDSDLAIIKLTAPTDKVPIRLGEFANVKPGGPVTVISNPLGFLEQSVTDGVVSARRLDKEVEIIQFTAPISQGSSGGPVFNELGEAIGVIRSYFVDGQSLNIAVAQPAIHRLLDKNVALDASAFCNENRKNDLEKKRQKDLESEKLQKERERLRTEKLNAEKVKRAETDAKQKQIQSSLDKLKEYNEDIKKRDIRIDAMRKDYNYKQESLNRKLSEADSNTFKLNNLVSDINAQQAKIDGLISMLNSSNTNDFSRASIVLSVALAKDELNKIEGKYYSLKGTQESLIVEIRSLNRQLNLDLSMLNQYINERNSILDVAKALSADLEKQIQDLKRGPTGSGI